MTPDERDGRNPASDPQPEDTRPGGAEADKTVSDKPSAPEAAPKAGIEREDAPPSGELSQSAGEVRSDDALEVRRGMFHTKGSGDTSGYGEMRYFVERPHSATPPYGGWFDEVAEAMAARIPDVGRAVTGVSVHRGEITFYVARDHLLDVVRTLRDDQALRFEFFSGVSGVHYPADEGAELHAVYHLLSMTHNRRIRLEVTCPDADPHIPSVVAVYPAADWHERETWDMFGVVFDGHPALTRILMPDDWPGFPQRKDYPLGGVPVEYKGATIAPPDERRSYN